jgi:hypothetical protein
MIIVYRKKTMEFVGAAARVFDSGKWREPTMEELYPNEDPQTLGFFHVEDSAKLAMAGKEYWQFKLDEKGVPAGIERKPSPPAIQLSSDAPDTDGDGTPELPADGQSAVTITAELREAGFQGKRIVRDVPLVLKTTAGTLSQRFVLAQKGIATVTLTTSRETVAVTVTASAEGFTAGSLTFELLPPADAALLLDSSRAGTPLEARFGIPRALPILVKPRRQPSAEILTAEPVTKAKKKKS